MPTPITNGVLRTKLSDMKVGDYIKWYYHGFSQGVLGEFSQSPAGGDDVELPSDQSKVCQTTADIKTATGVDTDKTGGYFYFIKVNKGMLLADRGVQTSLSAQNINLKSMFKGSVIRLLTFEEFLKIKVSDLEGNVSPGQCFHYDFTTIPDAIRGNVNALLTQDLRTASRTGYSDPTDKTGFTLNYVHASDNWGSCTAPLMLVPVMEYVDNSKSTNIFY